MMRTNAICTVLLLLGASLAPGGAFGAGEPRQDAVARADPGVTNQGAHSVEASWSLSEGAGYETQNVVLDPGKANLSQVTTSGGDLWKQQTGLGNGNEREDFSAAYDDVNNQMIIHGGYYYILGMQDASWSQPLYTYDPAADSWTARGTAKLPAGNVAAWDRADQAFVTHGGYYTYFDQNQGRTLYVVHNSTFAWYPSSSSWTQLSDGPRLYHHSAVWDPDDGVMLVFGGMDTRLVQNQSVNTYFGNLWAYNLTLDNWTQLNASGGPPMSRAYHTAVWDNESGQMIVFGGYDGTQHFSDVWAYNYTQNRWTQKTSAPSGRSLHAACWNSAQNLMTVYGGTPGVGNSNDTLSYDPSADQWSSNTKMPAPGRLQPAAVYDPVRQEMLVYGGGTGSGRDEYSQTWSFKYGDKVLRYVAEGSIQSPVFDIGEGFYAVDGISWYGDMPLGANLILRFRASPTDINNSGFVETANDSRPTPQGRYIQWNITLKSTADRKESPSLGLVRVAYSVNKRPTAAAGPAQDAFKRTRVTLAGAGTDPDGDGLTYRWAKLSGPMAALNATDISNPGFSPEFTGLYVFTLVVNDGYADSPVATATVRVPNRLPRSDAGPDQTGLKNTLVSFRGNGTDPDGDPLTYEWSQVDGPPLTLAGANKPILTFVPPKLGKYTFKLVVSDGEESSPPAFVNATISGRPPVASLTASPETVFLNQTVNFSAELSTDEDGSVTLYSFDFGDGNSTGWVPDSRASHAYQRPGTFNASLLVRDDDGFNSSFSPAVKVTVRNRSPVVKATVSQDEGTSSTLFRFSVPSGGAYDPDGTIVSYQWDFGDGTCATASTASHTFRAKGTHEVRFRVTDNWGAFSEVYFNITILNRAPEISAAAPSTPLSITLGWEQEFKVTAVDPDNDTLSYNWTLNGAPQASNGSQLLLKPEKKGEYQVGLTVSDGEQSVSREWTLSVKPKPSNREEANAMLLVLPAALILIVIAAAVAAVAVRRSRRKEPEAVYAPPGYQPAAEAGTAQAGAQGQAPAEAPADAIPFAAPVDPAMAGPSRPGYSSPQEAIPYAEPIQPQAGQAAPPEAKAAPEDER